MVIATPTPSQIVLDHIDSDKYRDRPILAKYPGYEVCFLAFHPFLKIKSGHHDSIEFVPDKWPNKKEIIAHCDLLTWTSFLELSGIPSYQRLSHTINFMHCAISIGNKDDFDKLLLFTAQADKIICPTPDYFPQILEDKVLNFFKTKKYDTLYIYTDTSREKEFKSLDSLLLGDRLPPQVRLQTTDNKILIITDFDCCHSYFLGSLSDIKEIVDFIDLEGFYCNNQTPEHWSFYEVPSGKQVR